VQVVQSFQCTGGLIGSSFQKLFWVKSTGMVLEERFSARGLPPPRLKSCIKKKRFQGLVLFRFLVICEFALEIDLRHVAKLPPPEY